MADVAGERLKAGVAVTLPDDPDRRIPLYAQIGREARKTHRGISASPFQMPWLYRKSSPAKPMTLEHDMRTFRHILPIVASAALLAGCAGRVPDAAHSAPRGHVSATDAYWKPDRVSRSRQEYAPDWGRFPPLITQRTGYPTEAQANNALRRSHWSSVPVRTLITEEGIKTISVPAEAPDTIAAGVRVFACRPGALNGYTGRVQYYDGPVVACASDLLSADGRVLARVPLNFYYWQQAWRVQDPRPSYKSVPWAYQEPSPPKSKGWFGNRY
ncbi:hypothetical protein [Mesorhizobium sp. M0809]|uniref:hypothetical protein n=1 Tax=Mesorhizobium sp. M0809 TaxID=2957003 RepID=UPI00333C7873